MGGVIAHLLHGLNGMVSNGNTLVVGFPYSIGSVLLASTVVHDVFPFVCLIMPGGVCTVVSSRYHDVVVNEVVATELADDCGGRFGISRREELCHLFGIVYF